MGLNWTIGAGNSTRGGGRISESEGRCGIARFEILQERIRHPRFHTFLTNCNTANSTGNRSCEAAFGTTSVV